MNQPAKLQIILIIYLISASLYCGTPLAVAEPQCKGDVCFSWAFGAIVEPNGTRALIQVKRDTTLNSGDQLKMLLKLRKKCFVYVFYHGPQGELHMLFPYDLSQFSKDYEVSKEYYIPKGDLVLELDEIVGKEKIYLLASIRRLPKLEDLYTTYKFAEYSKRSEIIEKIIHEIRKQRIRHKKFTIEAERPVASIGSIRGHVLREEAAFTDLEGMAIEFTAKNFFAKTFTIDHK